MSYSVELKKELEARQDKSVVWVCPNTGVWRWYEKLNSDYVKVTREEVLGNAKASETVEENVEETASTTVEEKPKAKGRPRKTTEK